MKELHEIQENLYYIVSEPGDATRYEYLVYMDGPDNFCFMPARSTFRFPQRLNYYEVKGIGDSGLALLIEQENCNSFTLRECIRTVIELFERD